MKKFVFAGQVFGIIALFPIYVILEMNHGIERVSGKDSQQDTKEIILESIARASRNAEALKKISISDNILPSSTTQPNKNEIIKALAEVAHKAY